jgi:hypothetical protein
MERKTIGKPALDFPTSCSNMAIQAPGERQNMEKVSVLIYENK